MSGFNSKQQMAADKLQEDLINYGTAWSQDGKRIDPMSVYKEPAQEPVAECVDDGEGGVYYRTIKKHIGLLYTAPPQRKPWVSLSDGQRKEIIKRECRYTSEAAQLDHQHLCYAIDAKLKERNHGT